MTAPLSTVEPRDAMRAFARGEGDADDVFRALIAHANYLVPLPTPVRTAGVPEQFSAAGEYPPGELWLFTDRDAALAARAAGSRLGTLGYGATGIDLFTSLPAGLTAVRVNPVSPPEVGWNVPAEALPILRTQAAALAFERAAAAWPEGAPDLAAFAAHPLFHVLLRPDGAAVTLSGRGGLRSAGVVLTAPDCVREVRTILPPELNAGLRVVVAGGAEILEKFPGQGMDGVALNPAGPGLARTLALPARRPAP